MKNKEKNFHQELMLLKRENKKISIMVYFLLRILVIICMILQLLRGDLNNAFLCLLSLVLFMLPFFISKKLKIELSNTLEIIILLFIFSAEILGEINNFYRIIPYWDTILHTINGFLAAGTGFALFDILNKNIKSLTLSPLFLSLVAFCFSMTIGVLWEFFEYGYDTYFYTDMQKDRIISTVKSIELNEEGKNIPVILQDVEKTIVLSKDKEGNLITTEIEGYLDIGLIDTMKDLAVNCIGALLLSIIGYLYILNRDKYRFVNYFIPTKQEL